MQNWFNPPVNTYGNAIQNSYPVTGVQNPYTANVPTGEQLLKVNGIDGAKAFLTRPNSQVALFDANDDIMYIKTTDAANYPVIRKFKFVEVKEEDTQNLNYVTTDDLAKFKEEAHATKLYKMFEEYYQKITETYSDHIPSYLKDIKTDIDDMYMEYSAKTRYLNEMYSK